MYKVSVIIPTHNRAAMVRTAIESVLAQQTRDIALEVIVIDDRSQDNTSEAIQDLPIRYLKNEGQGVSAARNTGMDAATGEFIAFLDDDDIWATGYPQPQLELLAQHPEYGAAISQYLMADEHLNPVMELGAVPTQAIPSGWMFDAFLYYTASLGSTIVRTSVVRELGGFDTSLRGSEDWDWMLRISAHYQIGFVPAVSQIVRQHPVSRAFTKKSEDEITWRRFRDTMRVFRRHTRQLPITKKIRLQRQYWKLRGWYVPHFMEIAHTFITEKSPLKALRSTLRSLQASPIHTALYCYRSLRHQ